MSEVKQRRGSDNSTEWRELREKTLERDDKKCHFCGMTNTKHKKEYNQGLHIHHAHRTSDGGVDKISNLTSVCSSCHKKLEDLHADAVKTAVEEQMPFSHIDKPRELLDKYHTSAKRLEESLISHMDKYPTIKKNTEFFITECGDIHLQEGERNLLNNPNLKIHSENYLMYAFGYCEALQESYTNLDDLIDFKSPILQEADQ